MTAARNFVSTIKFPNRRAISVWGSRSSRPLASTRAISPCWLMWKMRSECLGNLLCDKSEQEGDKHKPFCDGASEPEQQREMQAPPRSALGPKLNPTPLAEP